MEFKIKNIKVWIMCICMGMIALSFMPFTAHAQTQECSGDPKFANIDTGPAIIHSIFGDGTTGNPGVINSVLNAVSETFYNSIIGNPQFKGIVGGLLILYVAIYGVMIMFNMVHIGTYDLMGRAFKIGVVYAMVFPFGGYSSGWAFFYGWIGGFFMGGMNEIITQFSQAGVSNMGVTPVVFQPGVTVHPGVMQSLLGPIGQVFSAKFITVIMALFSVKEVGPIMAMFLIWALIDFVFMVVGAMATYLKSVVGLAFLFGIAPIFILFLMFDKTRQVFLGWINQVVAFTITPILLFAFLAFYCQLISGIVTGMLYQAPTNPSLAIGYCWSYWFSIPGLWDFWWWMPKYLDSKGAIYAGGDCLDKAAGGTPCIPVQMVDILYFLLLCHLGKEFCKFIDTIAQDLSNATGPGIVQGAQIGSWIENNLTKGINPTLIGTGLVAGGLGYEYFSKPGVTGKNANAGLTRPGNVWKPSADVNPAQKVAAERTLTGIRPAISSYMFNYMPNPQTHDAKVYSDTTTLADENIQAAITKQDASGKSLLDKYATAADGSADKAVAANEIRSALRAGIVDAAHAKNFPMQDKQIDAMVDNVSKEIKLPPKKP